MGVGGGGGGVGGLGFRVKGLALFGLLGGFWDLGLGLGVFAFREGLGLRVKDLIVPSLQLGFRVSGLGFRVSIPRP